MTQRPTTTFRSGKGPWVCFAMGAGERWLTLSGRITTEMRQFGSYLRLMRYRQGYSIRELSDELDLPYEDILMLEVGLLKPSEVPSPSVGAPDAPAWRAGRCSSGAHMRMKPRRSWTRTSCGPRQTMTRPAR